MKEHSMAALIGIAAALILIAWLLSQIIPAHGAPKIASFDECVAAGNPVMESYPRQCAAPGGDVFVEEISDEDNPTSATPRCVLAGCSGQLCVEEMEAPNIVTTCEFRAEYACYAQHGTCERQETGQCGWTDSDTLNACLVDPVLEEEVEEMDLQLI